MSDLTTDMDALIEEQRQLIEALKADARRYRWLRDHQVFEKSTSHEAHMAGLEIAVDRGGDEWDALIDAAMKAG